MWAKNAQPDPQIYFGSQSIHGQVVFPVILTLNASRHPPCTASPFLKYEHKSSIML